MDNPWLIGIVTGLIVAIIIFLWKIVYVSAIFKTIILNPKLIVPASLIIIILIIAVSIKLSSNSNSESNQIPGSSISAQSQILSTTPISSTNPKTQPTSPDTTIPIVPGESVSAAIQSTSNVLALNRFDKDEGLYWTTTYTLSGYVMAVIKNPTANDITALITIDFKLPEIPGLSSSTIQLSSDNVSWTLVTANPNELKFQTSKWGQTLNAGHKLTLPLALTISTSQRSAIANNPWQQSYPFSASISVN